DEPRWIPGGVAPASVVGPTAMIDGKLECRGIVAIDIEANGDTVVTSEIGIARAGAVVGVVLEIGAFGEASCDVKKLVVAREAELGVGLVCRCLSRARRRLWVAERQTVGRVPPGLVQLTIEVGWLWGAAANCNFFGGRKLGRCLTPALSQWVREGIIKPFFD